MKSFDKFDDAEDENEMVAILFRDMSREKLETYCEVYDPEFAAKIDWDKGCTILDDELEAFITDAYRRKDGFTILAKATTTTGLPCRFLTHMIFKMEVELIRVGFWEIPEGTRKAIDPEAIGMKDIVGLGEYAQMVLMMMKMLRSVKIQKKNGTFKPLDNSPHCTSCGRSDLPLTIAINASTGQTHKMCSVCMSRRGKSNAPKKKVNIAKIDKEIAELEKLAKDYEELIAANPDASDVPAELSPYAMTPMSNYKAIQALLAEARSERMAAMTSMQGENRLKYELDKAVAEEDYEKSAKLRDKLRKIMK